MTLADTALVWTALGIALLTLGVGAVTMGTAGVLQYRHRRNRTVEDRLRTELFERLFASDPEWDAWVGGLSRLERRRLRRLLEEFLRKLRGTEHRRLRGLGEALGVQARARRDLKRGRRRFRALTWLALLHESVEPDRLEACCTGDSQLRAGAARVLHEADHPDAPRAGTDLLVTGESLTVFGLDTLYQLNEGTETPLLSLLETGVDDWNDRLLVQVLIVLRYCNIANPRGRLGWLPALLAHDSPRVRAAAVGVLERHGWREQFQAQVNIGALVSDPDASVRHDTYLLLASWNTEHSAGLLRGALESAPDEDLLALARACSLHSRVDLSALPARFDPYVEWVRGDEAVGRGRRVWGVSTAWG